MLAKNIDNDEKVEILTNEKLLQLTTVREHNRRQYEIMYDQLINNRQRRFQQNYISLMIILNISVIIITILRNELITDSENYNTSRIVVSVLCTAISLISIFVVILRYSLSKQIYNAKFSADFHFFSFLSYKKKWFSFIFEVLINALHPFPFVDKGMTYITMLIFLRLYPLFWSVTYFSVIYQNRDSVQNAIETMGGFRVPKFSAYLGLKELLYTHSVLSLIAIAVVVIPSFSYILYFSEKGFESTIVSYPSTIYWGIITMTSVGYGDIYPNHDNPVGMIIAAITAVSGTVVISLLSGVIVSALDVSNSEQMASQVAQRVVLQNNLRLISAQIIQTAVRLRIKPGNFVLVKRFFQLIIRKNEIIDEMKSQMGYRDSFVAADAMTELIEFTSSQEAKYKDILDRIMKMRTQVGIITNVFGVVEQKKTNKPQQS